MPWNFQTVVSCSVQKVAGFGEFFNFLKRDDPPDLKKKVADRKFTEHQSTKNQEQDLFQLLFFF